MQRSFTRLLWIAGVLAATGTLFIETCSAASSDKPNEQVRKSSNESAKADDAQRQYYLGKSLIDDHPVEGLKWIRLAAVQGHAPAQYSLGFMYEHGIVVPQDKNEAAKWYQLAAAQGHEEAQYALGIKTRPTPAVEPIVRQSTSPNDDRKAQNIGAYQKCNSDAQAAYEADWNNNCASVHARELDLYYTCLRTHRKSQYNGDPWGCGRIYQTDTPSYNCSLPTALADSLKQNLWRAQDICSKRYGLY